MTTDDSTILPFKTLMYFWENLYISYDVWKQKWVIQKFLKSEDEKEGLIYLFLGEISLLILGEGFPLTFPELTEFSVICY